MHTFMTIGLFLFHVTYLFLLLLHLTFLSPEKCHVHTLCMLLYTYYTTHVWHTDKSKYNLILSHLSELLIIIAIIPKKNSRDETMTDAAFSCALWGTARIKSQMN